jgi:hypothetical protein
MMVASWIAYGAGGAAIVLATLFLTEMTSTRGHRAVSGAIVLGFVAIPVLLAAGATLIWAGIVVRDGAEWARLLLEISAWITLIALVGVIVNRARRGSVHRNEVIRGVLLFAIIGAPAIAMIWLLRFAR